MIDLNLEDNYSFSKNFQKKYSLFCELIPKFNYIFEKVFPRNISFDGELNVPIYLLSWQAFEDFKEIIFLSSGGYGIGAMKPLRAFYERVVTLIYLGISGREEIEKFVAFDRIDAKTGFNHFFEVLSLKNSISQNRIDEIRKQATEVESLFSNNQNIRNWTRHSLKSMAHKIDKEKILNEIGNLEDLYGCCYFLPTKHHHSTSFSFRDWIIETTNESEISIKIDRAVQNRFVDKTIASGHAIFIYLVKFGNLHFSSQADEDIEELILSFKECWTANE